MSMVATGTMQSDNMNKPNPTESYLHQLSGQEKEPDFIMLDHSYAKPWNAHPDSSHARPARMLFMKGLLKHHTMPASSDQVDQVALIDVNSISTKTVPPYDNFKTRTLMNECEKFIHSIHPDGSSDDFDEGIKRMNCTVLQSRLFNKVMKVFQADRLSRLACEDAVNEPVMRRIYIDKTARRIRQIFASVNWDFKLLHWLHGVLMENFCYSAAYLDVLQVLKSKIPVLIEKILSVPLHSTRSGSSAANSEALSQLLRRPWDPVGSVFNQHKPKKLPGVPLIVIVPSGPNQQLVTQSRRMRFWHSQLAGMGKVVNVAFHLANGGNNVKQNLESVIGIVRTKVAELKKHFPGRPVILLGWTVGALIACHVALLEAVTVVVCLGFPLTGISGSHGDLDDPLLDSKVPTLFVIGQNANTCSVDDMEDFRERMRAKSGLVVVGGADDLLRISHIKKKLEGVTQEMVDKCLVDEVGDFLVAILTQPPVSSPPSHSNKRVTYMNGNTGQEIKKRKRKSPKSFEEAIPVKRRPRGSSGRQVSIAQLPLKTSSTSSSSTDTSSTGSSASDNGVPNILTELPKRNVGRRPGRPPADMQRKRKFSRNASKTEKTLKTSAINAEHNSTSSLAKEMESTKNSKNVLANNPAKSSKSLSLNIGSLSSLGQFRQSKAMTSFQLSQKTNQSIDSSKIVEDKPRRSVSFTSKAEELKSSGSHSVISTSFDSTIQATTTVSSPSKRTPSKATFITFPGTLSGMLSSAVVSPTISPVKTPLTSDNLEKLGSPGKLTSISSSFSEALLEPDKEQVEAIQKLQYHDFPLTTACLTKSTSTGIPVITQAKILTSGSLDLVKLQNLAQATFTTKSFLTTTTTSSLPHQSTSSVKSPTLLLSSSGIEPGAFLISSPTKTSSGKNVRVQHMILKSTGVSTTKIQVPIISKVITKPSTSSGSEQTNTDGDQTACNLSLLSDVAGTKEPIKESSEEMEAEFVKSPGNISQSDFEEKSEDLELILGLESKKEKPRAENKVLPKDDLPLNLEQLEILKWITKEVSSVDHSTETTQETLPEIFETSSPEHSLNDNATNSQSLKESLPKTSSNVSTCGSSSQKATPPMRSKIAYPTIASTRTRRIRTPKNFDF